MARVSQSLLGQDQPYLASALPTRGLSTDVSSVSPLCPAWFPHLQGTRLRGEASTGGGAGERRQKDR